MSKSDLPRIDEHAEQMKRCTKCGKEYEATRENFNVCKLAKFGLSPECKTCLRKRRTKYYAEHPDKALDKNNKSKEYKKKHPSWLRDVKHRSYERHREKVIEKSRQYRRNTPGYAKLPWEKKAAKAASHTAKKYGVRGRITSADIRKQFDAQGGKCFYCHGEFEKYDVDHFIPFARGGCNSPENIVIACDHCNSKKWAKMPGVFLEEIKNG